MLKPVCHADIPSFVMNLVDRLHGAGFCAYIVGGAVRDMLLDRPISDWDVATSALPGEIMSLFQDMTRFKLKHDTVTLVRAGSLYEITTMKGHNRSKPDIMDDLDHRDFTIDAMAYDTCKKAILDPHKGKKDILRKQVRAVGSPVDRFIEDPLRLIRAIRIANDLNFSVEGRTFSVIHELSHKLKNSARERVRDELMKILLSSSPSNGINNLRKTGLLEQILPELLEGYRKRQNHRHRYTIYRHIMETVDGVEPDAVLRLTALFHDIAKPRVRRKIKDEFRFFGHAEEGAKLAEEIMLRLKFRNELINKVRHLIQYHMIFYNPEWRDSTIRRLLRRIGKENMDYLLSFRKADMRAHGYAGGKIELISELEDRVKKLKERSLVIDRRDLAVGGTRVMDILNLSRGPEVGTVLEKLMERVIEDPKLNTEKALVALLEEMKENEEGITIREVAK